MANTNVLAAFPRTLKGEVVHAHFLIFPQDTADPVVTGDLAFMASCVRSAAGVYTLTLKDTWAQLINAQVSLQFPTSAPLPFVAAIGDVLPTNTSAVDVLVLAGFGTGDTLAGADIDANAGAVSLFLVLRNSAS